MSRFIHTSTDEDIAAERLAGDAETVLVALRRLDDQLADAERECDALAARVKELEEAGEALVDSVSSLREVLSNMGVTGSMGLMSIAGWSKAKEYK